MDKMNPMPASRRPDWKNFKLVELSVHKDDVILLKQVVSALGDPSRSVETRALLREQLPPPRPGRFKELLLSLATGEDYEVTVEPDRDESL